MGEDRGAAFSRRIATTVIGLRAFVRRPRDEVNHHRTVSEYFTAPDSSNAMASIGWFASRRA